MLLDKLKEVSELISAEKNEIEETGIVRCKRQQLVLLEKVCMFTYGINFNHEYLLMVLISENS